MVKEKWESYEEVATFLLNRVAKELELGIHTVEGKQIVSGHRSGTRWEIDGKGIAEDGKKFVILECRRLTTSKVKQEHMAAIAYRISDIGASGGIVVSPLDINKGAKLIAQAENVVQVTLSEDSTTSEYFLKFLNKIHIGVSDTIDCSQISESIAISIIDKDGNVVENKKLL